MIKIITINKKLLILTKGRKKAPRRGEKRGAKRISEPVNPRILGDGRRFRGYFG